MSALRGAYRGVPTRAVDEEPRSRRLAYASSTVMQTLITTVTDVTGISINWTVTAADLDGGRYACYVEALPGWLQSATSSCGNVARLSDEANTTKNSQLFACHAAGAYAAPPLLREIITAAGTYTRKMRLERSTGTGTITHNVNLAESVAWIEARLVRVVA